MCVRGFDHSCDCDFGCDGDPSLGAGPALARVFFLGCDHDRDDRANASDCGATDAHRVRSDCSTMQTPTKMPRRPTKMPTPRLYRRCQQCEAAARRHRHRQLPVASSAWPPRLAALRLHWSARRARHSRGGRCRERTFARDRPTGAAARPRRRRAPSPTRRKMLLLRLRPNQCSARTVAAARQCRPHRSRRPHCQPPCRDPRHLRRRRARASQPRRPPRAQWPRVGSAPRWWRQTSSRPATASSESCGAHRPHLRPHRHQHWPTTRVSAAATASARTTDCHGDRRIAAATGHDLRVATCCCLCRRPCYRRSSGGGGPRGARACRPARPRAVRAPLWRAAR